MFVLKDNHVLPWIFQHLLVFFAFYTPAGTSPCSGILCQELSFLHECFVLPSRLWATSMPALSHTSICVPTTINTMWQIWPMSRLTYHFLNSAMQKRPALLNSFQAFNYQISLITLAPLSQQQNALHKQSSFLVSCEQQY